eukprot:CAMPEP_0115511438 /NCGR_PEP_ID=MMETSP0271-20121206/73969_1 /TAXON_ID=71861 /ORGANISM="Scrippsiella trochoidea, Strain CCMP3099" /LENGTH=87 /DNA_ID=CAMNT_0002941515 /DNA_START=78 /DNA_END=340 /DNA_ORIENTATION=-
MAARRDCPSVLAFGEENQDARRVACQSQPPLLESIPPFLENKVEGLACAAWALAGHTAWEATCRWSEAEAAEGDALWVQRLPVLRRV